MLPGERGLPSSSLMWEQPQPAELSRTGALPSPQVGPPHPFLCAAGDLSVSASPGLVEGLRKRLLPAWCAPLAHGLSLLLVAVAVGVSGWVGAGFPSSVSVMWLLSSSSSFLASFLFWEPLKVSGMQGGQAASLWHPRAPLMPALVQVLLEALYFSLVAKRLHPDEDDTLVESPAVTPVSERVPRVRPPHGFALFLAKEEARKVKRLHGMLRVSSGHAASACPPSLASWPGQHLPGGPAFLKNLTCTLFLTTKGPLAGGIGLCSPRPNSLPSPPGPSSCPTQMPAPSWPHWALVRLLGLHGPRLPPGLALSTRPPGCGHFAAQRLEALLCHGWGGGRLGSADSGSSLPPRAFWCTCSSCW